MQEYPREMSGGVQMAEFYKFLCQQLDIAMDQRKQANTRRQDKDAFGSFNR
jgi:hypothetical protein